MHLLFVFFLKLSIAKQVSLDLFIEKRERERERDLKKTMFIKKTHSLVHTIVSFNDQLQIFIFIKCA